MANRNFFLFSSFWVTNGSCLIFKNVKVHIVSPCFAKKHLLFGPSARGLPAGLFDVWRYGLVLLFAPVTRWTHQPLPGRASVGWPGENETEDLQVWLGPPFEDTVNFWGPILKVAYVWHGAAAICTSILALQDAAGQEMHKDEAKKPVWHITPEIWKKQDFFKGPCSPREYLYILQSEHFKKSNATTVKDA